MKSQIHVFSRMLTKSWVSMFLFVLFAVMAAPSAWAVEYVTQNDQTVSLCNTENQTKMVEVKSGIETLKVSGGGGSVKGCIGNMTLKAPDGYGFVMSGWTSAPGKITIYDGYQFNLSYAMLSTGGDSNISDLRNTSEYVSVALDDAKSPDRVLYLELKVKKLHSVKAGGQGVIYKPYPATWNLLDDIKMIEGYSVYLYTVNNGEWITTSLKVKDADSNLVSTKGYNDSLQFYMPKKDVRVTYSEEHVNQLEYIDMLCMTRTVNLTDKVKSFKIYDNGGSSENYTNYCDARLTLIPPDGYQIRLTGTVTTEAAGDNPYDYLEIDDGEYFVKKVFSTSSSSTASVGTVTTTHRSMYLYFHSDQSNVAAGLNLTAELVGDPHTVTVNSANNGTVTPSSSSVATGDEVTLTAKPKSGYALKSVSVVTSSGEAVPATSSWETNEIKFKMPNSNVKVTPTFASDTYDIIKTTTQTGGTLTVASSAKINSTVTITANPETGYMLKDIVVKDANNNTIKMVKNNFTSFSFTMPLFSNVTVTPTWTTVLTAEGGLYVNMPKSGGSAFRIPAGVKSFKIYDDGGKDGAYSNNANGSISLRAPVGYVLVLKGSVNTNSSSDNLKVYSSYTSFPAEDLLGTQSGSSNCAFVSKDSSLALKFVSDGSGTGTGLDLTVNVVKYELEQGEDEGTHYVNMFYQHKMEYNIPETLQSFKVYDEGGKDGAYSGKNRDTLVLKAPEGYVLQLSGNVTTDGTWYDSLRVYSGTVGNADTVLLGRYRVESISGKVLSRGNSMTLVFNSDGYGNYAGLDLTVALVKLELEQGEDEGTHYVNMFYQRKMEYNIPETLKSFKVYDDGGKDGNYGGKNRDTLVLKAPEGYVLQLSGSVATDYSWDDSLRVYSGTVGNADTVLLGRYRGLSESISGKVLSRGNSMTLVFNSDGYGNYAGLDLTVALVPLEYAIQINDVANGKVLATKTTELHVGDMVSLISVPTSSNYKLKDVVVKDASGNTVKVSQYSFSVSEFTMPASDVEVTPTFTNNLTAAGGLHLDMRKNVNFDPSIPAEIKSFKIYDNGGKSGIYEANSDDTLKLAAPKGYRIKLTGNVTLEEGADSLYIFDGSSFETKLFGGTSSSNNGETSIGEIISSDNHLTLRFKSNASAQYDGLELTATLIPTYTVTVENVDGGSVSSDKETAAENEIVTLTIAPDEFFVLSSISVVGSNVVSVTKVDDVTYTFKMPNTNVTVTPIFVEIPTISVVQVENGTLESDINHALAGETVTLTAKPAKGYLIDGVVVKDADNKKVTLNNDIYWYSGTNEVSFKMPAKAVTVTPKFSSIDNLSIVKAAGEIEVNIPENVTSFKIYDDGGPDGDYNYVSGPLWVKYDKNTNKAGLKLSGTVLAKEGVFLEIYAYENKNTLKPFYTYEGSSENVGPFINASSIMIDFETMSAESAAGIDLRVDVVEALGGGVEVAYDDALLMNDYFKRWATITDGVKTSALNITEDIAVDGVSLSREFKTGDFYNTIVFPFDVKADNLGGVQKVLRFNGFKLLEDQSWAVRMKRVWTTDSVGKGIGINAYYPYLVVMNTKTMGVSGRVTLRKTVEPIAMADGSNWTFHGTLAYMDMPEGNPNVYGFQDNKFVRAGEGSFVNPLRAYLLKPTPQQSNGRPSVDGKVYARTTTASVEDTPDEFYIVEDDENGEHTTIIGRYNVRTGEFKMLRNYDLKGRKLNGKPNAHKAYYGKKVINK